MITIPNDVFAKYITVMGSGLEKSVSYVSRPDPTGTPVHCQRASHQVHSAYPARRLGR